MKLSKQPEGLAYPLRCYATGLHIGGAAEGLHKQAAGGGRLYAKRGSTTSTAVGSPARSAPLDLPSYH